MDTTNRAHRDRPNIGAEASRSALAGMHEAMLVSQELFEQYAEGTQRLFAASSAGWTAGLTAAFAVEKAALRASSAMMDATRSNTSLFREITAAAGEAQQATLDAWNAGLSAVDTMVAGSRPN